MPKHRPHSTPGPPRINAYGDRIQRLVQIHGGSFKIAIHFTTCTFFETKCAVFDDPAWGQMRTFRQSGKMEKRLNRHIHKQVTWPFYRSAKSSCADRDGCPTWIRTMTRRVKVACATITPSGKKVWSEQGASLDAPVKDGNGARSSPSIAA